MAPHMFFCILSYVFLNLRHNSLIYVTSPLFPGDFSEKTKTNGVPKWQHFERLRKNSKKTQRCVRIAKFFRRRGSRSNAYF